MGVKLTELELLERARCLVKFGPLEAVLKFSILLSTKITGFCFSLFTAMPAKCLSTRAISHIANMLLELKVLGSSHVDINCLDLFLPVIFHLFFVE